MMQLVYFPYINLKDRDEVNFGNIKIWNFEKKANEYITDAKLRNHIAKILKTNVTKNGQPIANIGIVCIGNSDFHELLPDELQLVDELRIVLFLGFLSNRNVVIKGMNAGHFVATSENFSSVIQNFDVNNEYISEKSGVLIQKLDGGYTIDEFKSFAPPYVSFPLSFSLDESFITRLIRMRKKSRKTYDLILRSAEALFQAYYNDPFVSINARILLMASAFEILMQCGVGKAREVFKTLITKQCNNTNEAEYTFKSERGSGPKAVEKGTLKVMWADSFFTLRNHIIHGKNMKQKDYVFRKAQHHLIVGTIFYVFLVKQMISDTLKTKIGKFNHSIIWTVIKDKDEPFTGFIYEDNTRFSDYSKRKRQK